MTETMTSSEKQASGSRRKINWEQIGQGIWELLIHSVGQLRIWKKPYGGVMHFLIFCGPFYPMGSDLASEWHLLGLRICYGFGWCFYPLRDIHGYW